ncbi:hypothetical protein OIO90_006175 [Microbotryomycetes sp. JL221]|nr:hypothetical protein OIO90_006175 [Microbotryomycetes sp. JL221]
MAFMESLWIAYWWWRWSPSWATWFSAICAQILGVRAYQQLINYGRPDPAAMLLAQWRVLEAQQRAAAVADHDAPAEEQQERRQ